MNIIELYENAGIYRENITEFTFDDTVKVQKQFEIERTHNPNLSSSLQQDLIKAMNEFPKELLFISSNRILYNFFAKTNHSRNRFSSDHSVSVTNEAVKSFISMFLSADLDGFFEEKIAQNRFDDVEDFLAVKDYLPETSLNALSQFIDDKFDAVLNIITNNPSQESTLSFNFIKHRSFYDLLSHFRSSKNDERIRTLLNTMTSTLVDFNIKSVFLNQMMIAMGNYKAVDNDLASTLKFNKDQTLANTQKIGSSSSSALSTGGTIVLIIIVIRIILLMVRCNS